MKLIINGSGSSGNSYVLCCGGEKLLLDCGVPFGRITESLGYSWDGVAGCLVTHPHCSDHILPATARDLRRSGVSVYGNAAVSALFGWVEVLPEREVFPVGGFRVMSLPVPHGGCPCNAFVIDAPDGQRVLFATDLERFPYTVRGVNHLMVEANYSEDVLMRRRMDSEEVRSKSGTHMEFGETLSTVSRHVWGGLRTVTLLHLSKRLGDAAAFRSGVQRLLSERGCLAGVAVACRGELPFREYPWDEE